MMRKNGLGQFQPQHQRGQQQQKKKEQTIIEPHPSEKGSSIVKEEWRPDIKPEEAELRVRQFQPAETGSKPKEDRIGPGIGKTPQISPDEEKQDRDTLSPDAKKSIGSWGEAYALRCLKDELGKKYSESEVKETKDGFTIICDNQTLVEVHWLNKEEDKGEGYDIKVVENNIEKYIEVKSTKTDTKDWFEVSDEQWKLMEQEKDKFHIHRVYNAGTMQAKLVDIPNPSKLWREGDLIAYPIRIQI